MSTTKSQRKKPLSYYKDRLIRGCTQQEMQVVVDGCYAAIINRQMDVYIAFSRLFRWPEGFPKGVCVSKVGENTNIHKIKTKKLIAWLHENKWTNYTYSDIMAATRISEYTINELDRMFTEGDEDESRNSPS
jgi:hypothetical protein